MDPSDDVTVRSESTDQSSQPVVVPPPGVGRPFPGWLLTVGLALVAGLVSALVGEAMFEYFQPPAKLAAQAYAFDALNAEMARVGARNGAVAFGTLGALVGLALGVAGGLVYGSARRAVVGGLVGLIAGVIAGTGPAFLLIPYHWLHRNDDPGSTDLMRPLLVHTGLWLAIGLAAGLAYGISRFPRAGRDRWQAMLGGLAGAAIGIVLYELIGGIGFPYDRTTDPIAGSASTRFLAQLLVAGFVAIGILWATRPAPGKVVPPAARPDLAA